MSVAILSPFHISTIVNAVSYFSSSKEDAFRSLMQTNINAYNGRYSEYVKITEDSLDEYIENTPTPTAEELYAMVSCYQYQIDTDELDQHDNTDYIKKLISIKDEYVSNNKDTDGYVVWMVDCDMDIPSFNNQKCVCEIEVIQTSSSGRNEYTAIDTFDALDNVRNDMADGCIDMVTESFLLVWKNRITGYRQYNRTPDTFSHVVVTDTNHNRYDLDTKLKDMRFDSIEDCLDFTEHHIKIEEDDDCVFPTKVYTMIEYIMHSNSQMIDHDASFVAVTNIK